MDKEEKKKASREAARKYREKIRNNPEKHEERKAKQRERNRLRTQAIKADPIKYAEYLEHERKRGKQKRIDTQKDPVRRAKRNEYYKQYTENNRERVKKYQSRSSEEWKKINIVRRYNITVEYYDSLVEQQKGLCAICFTKPKKLFVDHCHQSGIVRALLCNKCNAAIGLLHEDLEILNNAVNYINKHKGLKDVAGVGVSVVGTKN